ncbi:MAG: hypothetical protein PHS57_09460 [Alphaproteobacteria bacterium]|nr:hypothetical protein [Alphaproteobacteria bacterium]
MKSFATLVKLQKNRVDEQRQLLSKLLDRLEQVENRIKLLEAARVREHRAASKNPMLMMTYPAFLEGLIAKRQVAEKEKKLAQRAVRLGREKLAELFEEQKRYEIAEEQRLFRIAQEERRVETIELDEIGGTRHERRKKA